MSLSESDQDNNVFVRHFHQQAKFNRSQNHQPYQQQPLPPSPAFQSPEHYEQNKFYPTVSWPILLAIIPTLGAFFVGSADIWSDFIMLLLILYYVYKWMTVPWAYYESARTRRIIHQKSSTDNAKASKSITAELGRHELAGLFLVVLSPAIAGYTLQYSRYLLSNADRYISQFNVTVFILAASIKPVSHLIALLQKRTLFLQSEALAPESQVQLMQTKLDLLEKEVYDLRKAFATKRDLGQVVTEDIHPSLQQLAKALERFERRDLALRAWSEEQFASIGHKVREYDQYIRYRIEQDQHQQAHGMVVGLILLPLNISLWVAKRMALLLPIPHGNSRNLLAAAGSKNESHTPSSRIK